LCLPLRDFDCIEPDCEDEFVAVRTGGLFSANWFIMCTRPAPFV
jgi:hypothetical protein